MSIYNMNIKNYISINKIEIFIWDFKIFDILVHEQWFLGKI